MSRQQRQKSALVVVTQVVVKQVVVKQVVVKQVVVTQVVVKQVVVKQEVKQVVVKQVVVKQVVVTQVVVTQVVVKQVVAESNCTLAFALFFCPYRAMLLVPFITQGLPWANVSLPFQGAYATKGKKFPSPFAIYDLGHRPHNNSCDVILLPLQGDVDGSIHYPGRCPGLMSRCPFRAHTSPRAKSSRPLLPGRIRHQGQKVPVPFCPENPFDQL